MQELVFDVVRDEAGNYCASATTTAGVLCTDAPSLDALIPLLSDLLALYAEDYGAPISEITLRLPVPLDQAA